MVSPFEDSAGGRARPAWRHWRDGFLLAEAPQATYGLHPSDRQGTIFSGVCSLSAQELASQLSLLVSRLRVRSFGLRAAFEEEVTTALTFNVNCGFWLQARQAALDLAGFFGQARRRGFADPESCLRGANASLRLADLCWQEVR